MKAELKSIGWSDVSITIFQALVSNRVATASEIRKATKLPDTTVRDNLGALVAKKLVRRKVSKAGSQRKVEYSIEDPKAIKRMLMKDVETIVKRITTVKNRRK